MDLRTDDLRLFVHCIDHGSVSAAGRALGLTQAAASRRLQRLETTLGRPVLHRTTRSLRLTNIGERLVPTARSLVRHTEAFERQLDEVENRVQGAVRVALPTQLGQLFGAAFVQAVHSAHPTLDVVLTLQDGPSDLQHQAWDVLLRAEPASDASLSSRSFGEVPLEAMAALDFADITHPRELLDLPQVGAPGEERLRAVGPSGERWSGTSRQALQCANRRVLADAAVAGVGFVLHPYLPGAPRTGLTRLLPGWRFGSLPLRALWLPEADRDPRVVAVVEVFRHWASPPTGTPLVP